MVHTLMSPSGYDRWSTCTASVSLSKGIVKSATAASDEGTFLHAVMAFCLKYGYDATQAVGFTKFVNGKSHVFTDDLIDLVQPGLDICWGYKGQQFVENSLRLDRWMPGEKGSADLVKIIDNKTLLVLDHKFGRMPVNPEKNGQLMLYALGAIDCLLSVKQASRVQKVILHIYQPRSSQGGGVWTVSMQELLDFGDKVRRIYERIKFGDVEFAPSEKACFFCPVAGKSGPGCKAREALLLDAMGLKFRNLDRRDDDDHAFPLASISAISAERRSFILDNVSNIISWLDTLQSQALRDALAGKDVPGYKAIEGKKGNRKWRDDNEVALPLKDFLGDDSYEQRLLSPAAAEKFMGKEDFKKHFSKYCIQNKGPPVLVKSSHMSPPIMTMQQKFAAISHGKKGI